MTSCSSTTLHGDLEAYKRAGCRCPEARAANTAAMKAYRLRLMTGWVGHVDGTGTRRRIRALVANGWDLQRLADRLGVSKCALSQVANSRRRVQATTATRIRVLYDQLADIPGPSSSARIRARKRGWLPPIWWDDETLDDPAHEPPVEDGPRHRDDVDPVVVDRLVEGRLDVRPTPSERFEAFLRLRAGEHSDRAIAARLHLSGATFADYTRRADAGGIEDSEAAA